MRAECPGSPLAAFILAVLLTTLLCGALFAGDTSPGNGELELYLNAARANKAHLLFPERFHEFELRVSERTSGVRDSLARELQDWLLETSAARRFFEIPLNLRESATLLGANQYAPVEFTRADAQLAEGGSAFLRHDTRAAERSARSAVQSYRSAQWATIRNSIIGQVKVLIQESEDLGAEANAPASYRRTRLLLEQVEIEVGRRNSADDILVEKSRRLLESANHLLYITQLTAVIHNSNDELERYLLQLSEQILQLSGQLGLEPVESEGYAGAIERMSEAVGQVSAENGALLERVRQLQVRTARLELELGRYQSEEDKRIQLAGKLTELQALLATPISAQDGFFTFSVDSLDFGSGQVDLSPPLRRRLTPLAEAISKFPGAVVIVQLVQYEPGSTTYSDVLAIQRSRSVLDFLRSQVPEELFQLHVSGITNALQDISERRLPRLEVMINLNSHLEANREGSGGGASTLTPRLAK